MIKACFSSEVIKAGIITVRGICSACSSVSGISLPDMLQYSSMLWTCVHRYMKRFKGS